MVWYCKVWYGLFVFVGYGMVWVCYSMGIYIRDMHIQDNRNNYQTFITLL